MHDAERERKRLMRWEQKCLHTLAPVCVVCGCLDMPALTEYRWADLPEHIRRKLLQGHHVARHEADPETVVILCRNCHAVLDDAQYDWPPVVRKARSREERIAALLAGAEDMLRWRAAMDVRLADRLHEIQEELLALTSAKERTGS
jgi:hypothetical protein